MSSQYPTTFRCSVERRKEGGAALPLLLLLLSPLVLVLVLVVLNGSLKLVTFTFGSKKKQAV
jgi:hypothetical protein